MAIQTYADTHTHKHKHTHQTTQYLQRVQASVCVCVCMYVEQHASSPHSSSCRALYTVLITFAILALYCVHNLVACKRSAKPITKSICSALPDQLRRQFAETHCRRGDQIISSAPPPNLYQDRGQQLGVQPCARVFQFNLHCNNKLISRRRSWQYLL